MLIQLFPANISKLGEMCRAQVIKLGLEFPWDLENLLILLITWKESVPANRSRKKSVAYIPLPCKFESSSPCADKCLNDAGQVKFLRAKHHNKDIELRAKYVINSAGLSAQNVSRALNVSHASIPRQYYAKGNYFALKGQLTPASSCVIATTYNLLRILANLMAMVCNFHQVQTKTRRAYSNLLYGTEHMQWGRLSHWVFDFMCRAISEVEEEHVWQGNLHSSISSTRCHTREVWAHTWLWIWKVGQNLGQMWNTFLTWISMSVSSDFLNFTKQSENTGQICLMTHCNQPLLASVQRYVFAVLRLPSPFMSTPQQSNSKCPFPYK